jgi:CBS-domain-containing membrane protein
MPHRTHISEIMTREIITIDVRARMSEVREILTTQKFHHLPVVDGEQLVGIVSTNDLIRVTKSLPTPNDRLDDVLDQTTSIKETMQTDLLTMRTDASVERAIDLLAGGEMHSILIIDRDEVLVGIVTNIDLLNYLFD